MSFSKRSQRNTMAYYNELITQKSWQTLQNLKNQIDFVLIGGWAVYLYTKTLKSKDIDIIVNYDMLPKLKNLFTVSKNERLSKYEARNEEVQIDIYLPFYSHIGVPVEAVINETTVIDTFTLPTLEILLIMKQYALLERKLSVKGEKDRLDILCLLSKVSLNFPKYRKFLRKFKQEELFLELKKLVSSTTRIPELGINEHAWSRIKKKLILQIQEQ